MDREDRNCSRALNWSWWRISGKREFRQESIPTGKWFWSGRENKAQGNGSDLELWSGQFPLGVQAGSPKASKQEGLKHCAEVARQGCWAEGAEQRGWAGGVGRGSGRGVSRGAGQRDWEEGVGPERVRRKDGGAGEGEAA